VTEFSLVTIDGGAATGKSSVARRVADHFGFLLVETGLQFRALAQAVAPTDDLDDRELESRIWNLDLACQLDGNRSQLVVDGQILPEDQLRSSAASTVASRVAALPAARQRLLEHQRGLPQIAEAGSFGGLVMEGRDIGSVVFPEAPHRFFLEASPEIRRQRRQREGIEEAVEARDEQDQTRAIAPLKIPDGAQVVDTSHLSLDEVVARLIKAIENDSAADS
jgi:cytidylate kinase